MLFAQVIQVVNDLFLDQRTWLRIRVKGRWASDETSRPHTRERRERGREREIARTTARSTGSS